MKRDHTFSTETLEQQWTCPITTMPMTDPVMTSDGHTYDKKGIQAWLKKDKTSPRTGLKLKVYKLIPNIILKSVIERYERQIKYEISKLTEQNHELKNEISECQRKTDESKKDFQTQIQNLKQQLKNQKIETQFLRLQKTDLQKTIEQLQIKLQKPSSFQSNDTNINNLRINFMSKEQEDKFMRNIQSDFQQQQKKQTIKREQKKCFIRPVNFNPKNKQNFVQKPLAWQKLVNQLRKQSQRPSQQKILQQKPVKIVSHPQIEQKKTDNIKPFSAEIQLFPFCQYLQMHPILYDQGIKMLDHCDIDLDMDLFLKFNWTKIQHLRLNSCRITDEAFQMLVEQAGDGKFPNVRILQIYNNQIKVIPWKLNKFTKLQKFVFSDPNKITPKPISKTHINEKYYLPVNSITAPKIANANEKYQPINNISASVTQKIHPENEALKRRMIGLGFNDKQIMTIMSKSKYAKSPVQLEMKQLPVSNSVPKDNTKKDEFILQKNKFYLNSLQQGNPKLQVVYHLQQPKNNFDKFGNPYF